MCVFSKWNNGSFLQTVVEAVVVDDDDDDALSAFDGATPSSARTPASIEVLPTLTNAEPTQFANESIFQICLFVWNEIKKEKKKSKKVKKKVEISFNETKRNKTNQKWRL